jgi:prevent-host-death family protein
VTTKCGYNVNMNVGVKQAKVELSKLIEAALSGDRVVITNRGKALVELVPAVPKAKNSNRGYGSMPGLLEKLPANWDSPAEDAKVAELFEDLG